MTGTLANVAFILFGGVFFLITKRELSNENQQIFRVIIAGLVLYTGFKMLWAGLSGGLLRILGQLGIVFVSMSLGRILGVVLGVQKGFNRIAIFAKAQLDQANQKRSQMKSGFLLATGLFCVTPLAVIGSLVDGTSGNYHPLLIKGMMDALATMSFARTFGLSVVLSCVPVLALQGSLTLLAQALVMKLPDPAWIQALSATSGCLVFSVILIAFGIQNVRLGDYLPSLLIAPLLAQWWW